MSRQSRRDLGDAWSAVESAENPLDEIDAIRRLREAAELAEQAVIRDARGQGISWTRIGALYGLTKQGAQQRFGGKRVKVDDQP